MNVMQWMDECNGWMDECNGRMDECSAMNLFELYFLLTSWGMPLDDIRAWL